MAKQTVVGTLLLLLAGGLLLSAGCAKKITLTPAGEKVEFIENADVIKDKLADKEKCKLVVMLKMSAKLGPTMGDKKKKEAAKRLIMARNAAARDGANVVVLSGELEGDTQAYDAYKCKVE